MLEFTLVHHQQLTTMTASLGLQENISPLCAFHCMSCLLTDRRCECTLVFVVSCRVVSCRIMWIDLNCDLHSSAVLSDWVFAEISVSADSHRWFEAMWTPRRLELNAVKAIWETPHYQNNKLQDKYLFLARNRGKDTCHVIKVRSSK
jgi:hypothetical protein